MIASSRSSKAIVSLVFVVTSFAWLSAPTVAQVLGLLDNLSDPPPALGTAASVGAIRPWDGAVGAHGQTLQRTFGTGARASAGNSAAASAAVTFETGSLSLSPQDTWININATNYSTGTLLRTYTWPDYQVANAVLMKFDFSALPAGAIVQEAKLNLALVQSDTAAESTYTVTAHKLLGKNPIIAKATGYTADGATKWTANACCYNGVPLAQADISAAYDQQAIDKAPGFKTSTITTMVQEWLADPASNFGLLLNADASKPRDHYRYFASMRYSDPSLRPYLSVTYVAGDATSPSVAITAPASGAILSGTVPVTANATDNVGVASVQFRLNGAPIGPEVTAYPYVFTWDTTIVSDGSYTLTAVARDWAGNAATSSAVSVTVKNGILLLSPQDTYLNINATNYSSDTILATYTWPDYKVANAIVMKFDLSALPPGAIVQEARLNLALVQSDSASASTYTVTAQKLFGENPDITKATGYTVDGVTAWTANACCYNGVPLAQADISSAYDTRAIDTTPGYKSWTITAMVQEWLADPATNFGLLLNSDTSKPKDRYRYFASMEHSDPSLRPFLRVTYLPPGPDTTPPTVEITAPAGGATVSGTVSVTAGASDNVGVVGVQFELDGANLGAEDTTAPYSISWNTTAVTDGSHTLTAVARDGAGNQTTTAAITVGVSNTAPPPSGGIAARYPGDAGIETDPNVVFVERFDESTLTNLFSRWTDILSGSAMSFSTDAPAGSPVTHSLNIPWIGGGVSDGGHLYRQLSPGVDDTLYVRYYVKYPTSGSYQHEGVWMGGYNPALAWPNPQAGIKPTGSDRFSASAEQSDDLTHFDHYDYWMNMRKAADGSYWGNTLLNNPNVKATPGQWMCVEHMVKLNNPVTALNGEHAIWINGVKVSHLGQGFPNGYWAGGNFTQDPSGSPFEGFQWRSTTGLNLNWIWLQVYAPSDPAGFTSSIKYAHVVAAKSYIGCLASGSSDTTPPTVSLTSPATGATVSGTITVAANASDNVGVAGVQFKLDGANLGAEDTTSPYSISWDTTTAANGTHTLTAVARDAAGNQATSASVSVSVNNASGGDAVFTSNWDTATGTSTTAVTDGGRWPNYWEFNNGSNVQLLSVVSGGVNGHNALRVQQRGSTYAANLQIDNILPQSKDYYLRYYMKNDDTSNSGDHIVTADTYNYANLTYMRKYGSALSWNFVVSLYGCGYTYPIGHWGPSVPLVNGQWYRFEYYVHYTDATHVQVHPRVYDATGLLILSDAQFLQSDFGQATWNGRSDWTLASYYAAGNSFCVSPTWMNDFGLGNNGQYGAADTGQYWYFSAVEIRTDRWPGAVQ